MSWSTSCSKTHVQIDNVDIWLMKASLTLFNVKCLYINWLMSTFDTWKSQSIFLMWNKWSDPYMQLRALYQPFVSALTQNSKIPWAACPDTALFGDWIPSAVSVWILRFSRGQYIDERTQRTRTRMRKEIAKLSPLQMKPRFSGSICSAAYSLLCYYGGSEQANALNSSLEMLNDSYACIMHKDY